MTKKKFMTVSKTLLSLIVVFNLVFTTAYAQVVDKGQIGQTVEKGDGQIDSRIETDKGDGDVSEKTDSTNVETGGDLHMVETAPVCDSTINLVANGSFETPVVDNDADWDIYQTETYGLGWQAEWNGSFAGAPQFANMEFQRGVNGWSAYDGQQYAELDADWGGPSDATFGEQASTKISQVISTVPGMTYEVSFAFAARPGTPDTENMMEAYINDISWFGTTTSSGEGLDAPYWIPRSFTFTADDTQTKISFADTGTPDSVGTFLDKVNVHCVQDSVACPTGMIYARVKLSEDPYGWRNWGNGNMSPKIFVGGNNPNTNEDGGNVYDSREYFPLTNPDGSFINDPDISGYRNVPGLAVERHEGSIRTVLYGFLYGDATVSSKDGKDTTEVHDTHDTGSKIGKAPLSSVIDYLANRELAQGSIEFSNDTLTRSTTVFPTSQKSDPMNPMDFVPGSNQYMPGSDNFHIVNNLSQFHMLATTGSDGFYTYYTYPGSKDGDCTNGGGEKTGTLVVHKFITDSKTDGTFEFNGPQGVFSITTVDGEGSATITGVTPGSYTLTENTQDGWHESAITTCMNVQITAGQTTNCNFYNTPDDGNNGCDDKQNCNPTACNSGEIWARVNVEDYANQGSGNVTNNIYLGSNANVIASGEWFMVYDGTNYINDPDITTYEDVPGLAVQRINGQVRVVLHGGNATEGDIEDISGNIEFFNGAVSSVSSDPSHPVEDGTNGTHDDGVTYSGDKSFFDLEVNTGNDGFYTNYAYQLDETCTNDGGGTTDVCPNIEGVQAVVPEGMHINNDGNCVNDDTNGGGTTDVCPNIDGIQTAIPEGQHLTEDGNCVDDGGNGGGGGGGSSSGGSGGSSHNQGEVLGAETGPTCARFNEYHDTGDTGGEIEALQTFLNEYMDAGLTVNGIYDWATTNAVHQFQAFHWNDIIDPWTPPLSPNTTGREYKTTVGTIDAIMGCPADPVFLEDPQTMYYIDKVQDQKPFTPDQIMKIANILDGVHGVTIGK